MALRLAGTASECPEELAPKTGPGTQHRLCPACAFLGRVSKSLGSRRKSLVDFAASSAVLLRPAPEIQAPSPCGNLHSSLINYERVHLHVRSSAKKLDKIDPPQFILSIFPRNGLPPMFYSWRHSALFYLQPSVTFSIYSIYSCKTPLGRTGGEATQDGPQLRAARTAPGWLSQAGALERDGRWFHRDLWAREKGFGGSLRRSP